MTTTHWRNAITGDFAKAGKWSDGRPGIKDDAVIAATGADYTVKVISADAAHVITLDSANATLLEKAQGSLHVGTLNIEAGTAVFNAANTIGKIVMTAGEVEISNNAALGGADISISRQAILAATANVEISNDIDESLLQATFAVKNGATFKMDGGLSFDTRDAATLNFTGLGIHGKGDGSGIIDLDGAIGAMSAHTTVVIEGATLGSSVANNANFDSFLSNALHMDIETNGVLDLTHQGNVAIQMLLGTGEILNSGAREALTFDQYSFGGFTKGDFDITLNGGGEFGGTIALNPGDRIHVIAGAVLHALFEGAAPAIDLEDPQGFSNGELSFEGAIFDGAGPAVDLGTGQDNNLILDHNFVGTITNFGGRNGGADTITFSDESGKGVPSLQYNPNEAGTGGELIVQYGAEPAYTLQLEGTYTLSDFTVDPGDSNQVACSAEQSSPHVPAHVLDALV
ncbi:MAG TPA: hypothetical protein VGG10_07240 [Rhizomicrobium sp.]|jgi:hypothetical protein